MAKLTEKERDSLIKKYFPEPYQDSNDYKELIQQMINPMMNLLPKNKAEDRAYLGTNPKLVIDFENVKKTKLSESGMSEKEVFADVVKMFEGAPNWGSSLSMMNVIPQANKAAIPAFLFTSIFSPNILEGEYAWNVHKAELECAGMLGEMAWGTEGSKAGAIFTYGGEAGWQYALQYGKTRVLKDSMERGVYTEAKVICSKAAQFSKQHSIVWAGLGTNNLIEIDIDENNEMKLDELEKVLKDLHAKDIPVAVVACTEGTTDANAFDSVEGAYKLLQKYPNNPAKYGKAVLFADSVIGFSWLAFQGYDFNKNHLNFDEKSIHIIKETYSKAAQIRFADCYSTDFHKSGYCPYVSTSFNYKNAEEFEEIMGYAKMTHSDGEHKDKYVYLQERSPYNPMNYSLESSRAANGSVAAWATLKYFGKDGFRLINGWEVEKHLWIRNFIEHEANIVTVNPTNHGQVTLFRIYDESVKNAKAEYEKELNDPAHKAQLVKHNKLIREVGDTLYSWYRSGKKIDGRYTPYMSFSTGFRPTNYNEHSKDPEAVIYTLKIYPMQFHATDETFSWVIKCVKMAMKEVQNKK